MKNLHKICLIAAVVFFLSLASCISSGGGASDLGVKPAEEAAKMNDALKSGKPSVVYYFLTT